LFTLVVRSHATRSSLLTDGINLIDEDDARLIRTGEGKEVSDSLCTNTDEHLHETTPRDIDERDVGLPRDGASQQGFASTGEPCE
jgi:hypothetical protein